MSDTKEWFNQQRKLVWRNGKLCWMVRDIYKEVTSPPWYKFWQGYKLDISYGPASYIEIEEIEE